ncbi:glycosyltransferase [Leptospira sp. 96542]|nr:glycosyltransferase [Leptospira sp. 96542]
MISIILPTYNESGNIKKVIHTITDLLKNGKESFEILVVDDNSPDGTFQIAQTMSLYDNRIRVFKRVDVKGLSSAVYFGFANALGNKLIVADADFQHDYTKIPVIANLLDDNQIVVASRRNENGDYGNFPFLRKAISILATKLTNLFFKVPIEDPMSGFFGITKTIYEETISILKPRGYKILFEILMTTQTKKIKEIGYQFGTRPWGESKLDSKVVFYFLLDIVSIKWNQMFWNLDDGISTKH